MSHHENLEQVLGHLRNLNLTDNEVETAVMLLNDVVAGHGSVKSIRVAHAGNPTEVAAFLAVRDQDFGPNHTAVDKTADTMQRKLLLVGYHYDHSR